MAEQEPGTTQGCHALKATLRYTTEIGASATATERMRAGFALAYMERMPDAPQNWEDYDIQKLQRIINGQ